MPEHKELAELLKTQKSLTEWLQDIGHKDVEALRREDNEKRERLKVLNRIINLPFDEPTQFEATDVSKESDNFKAYLKANGDELCALRLIPKKPGLPKLRMRGKTVTDAYAWFKEQDINAEDYRADFIPHPPDDFWATIFIVNKHGIQGEIIFGGHHQLTQGFHQTASPHVFSYDFKNWSLHPANNKALAYLKELVKYLRVDDTDVQSNLSRELGATFTHGFLEGYFESTNSSLGTWFIDYSPILGKLYSDMVVHAPQTKGKGKDQLSGQIGCAGTAEGLARVVAPTELTADFPKGSVLVCKVTTPEYVPLMQKAAAIITDQGGILSHAAIVARELKIPCIVGTRDATSKIRTGMKVTVDANKGLVSF